MWLCCGGCPPCFLTSLIAHSSFPHAFRLFGLQSNFTSNPEDLFDRLRLPVLKLPTGQCFCYRKLFYLLPLHLSMRHTNLLITRVHRTLVLASHEAR